MIIALWTHPRSVSTAFERIILERGDCEVLHEPFSHYYYHHHQTAADYQPDESFATDYEAIRELIFEKEKAHEKVFIKDMTYHCLGPLLQDDELLQSCIPVMLIRDPKKSIASHYDRNPRLKEEEIGYRALWQLHERLSELGKEVLVIAAEELQQDAARVYRQFCQFTGLTFDQSHLNWQAGEPEQWKSWSAWHKDASGSTGIGSNTEKKYEHTVENNDYLLQLYIKHKTYYQKLKAAAAQAAL